MEMLKSPLDFKIMSERVKAGVDPSKPVLVISAGTCGQASGANDLIRIAKKEFLKRGLAETMGLRITGCQGWCEMEPSILVEPQGYFYPKLSPGSVPEVIVAAAKGQAAEDLVYADPETGKRIPLQKDIPFFANQTRLIISRNEKVDPIRMFNYVETGGYSSLCKVIEKNDRKWVVDEIKASGLRGRGGAGFPTGVKWELLRAQPGDRGKYIICNADEGDPGAYMNRAVIEGNPHSVIEGMIIGAFGTGADRGIIYVRAEYPLAIKHLIIALRQARELGLLGKNILGSGLDFDIDIVKGAGAFVCGEETALIASIEGRMGEPRQRPPFPVQRGVHGRPTAINNVETWANVPIIFDIGAAGFSKIGMPSSPGTKIFSLVGKVRNTGLVEVPLGISIGKIIYDIGGGSRGPGRIKAVQMGGPSGGCIPSEKFDLSIDYETIKAAGAIMGSGGMIVMDQDSCMVDLAKYFMNFLKDESCGKCFTCRKGTQRMHEIIDDMSRGEGSEARIDLLEDLALTVRDTTMCGLGQSAPNPVLSTLRYFKDEFRKHIAEKRCDSFVCRDLTGAPCQAACPLGTEPWRYVACIEKGDVEGAWLAIREPNPMPSVCARVCNHPCESRCRLGTTGSEPIAIRALKRFVTDSSDPSSYTPPDVRKPGSSGRKAAVVGGGPAGISAAHYLSIRGHAVTIFEAEDRLGGMLAWGIPEYRLPRGVLEKEIQALLRNGVKTETGKALGRDFTLDSLAKDGFDAVFLAFGAGKSRKLGIPGEDADGVVDALDFLKAHNLRGESLAKGRVGVIGGGNAAVDAARVALRMEGVKSVSILYRRTTAEMPAFREEIHGALAEGVAIVELVSPVEAEAKGRNPKLAGVKLLKNSLGPVDRSGRRSPVPVPGSEYKMALDTLIVAAGEETGAADFLAKSVGIAPGGAVAASPDTFMTSKPGVFAGGDAARGPSTVVNALADGKNAAECIDRFLRGENPAMERKAPKPSVRIEAPASAGGDVEPSPRAISKTLAPRQRQGNFKEIEKTLREAEARKEAGRCLRCDLEFSECTDKGQLCNAVGTEKP